MQVGTRLLLIAGKGPASDMATICLATLNYAPEPIGIGPYSQGWAEALAARGHEVHVVCGVPFYPQWQPYLGYTSDFGWSEEAGVRVLRVPHYIPANPGGIRRLAHQASFARNLGKGLGMAARKGRPDAVVAIAPALLAAPTVARHADAHGAVSWLHVQDFEVAAALATGLLPRWLGKPGGAFERQAMRRFAYASSIAPKMVQRLADVRGTDRNVHELRNWAEPEVGRETAQGLQMRQKLGLPQGTLALYSGNLARKQGVGIILDAAKAMQGPADLHFVVCGEGPAAGDVEQAAKAFPNLHFRPLQPRAELPDLLDMADMHLLPQIAGAADLVLPSKLANMLASGRPVVATADPGTSLAAEVDGCGRVVPAGDVAAFVRAIGELHASSAERSALGQAARERAQARWEKSSLVDRFAEALEQAIAERRL